jgi:CDGSH-type Zn-finger protein
MRAPDKIEFMATKITVNNNGSLRIEGEIEIYDGAGNKYDLAGRTVIGLCRCGQSNNKPFCDGSHARCGFESQVVATVLPAPKPKP